MAINMENQVLSIEQMKHLEELGVDTSNASMIWQRGSATRHEWVLYAMGNASVSLRDKELTFTLQDMVNLMPKHIGDYTLNWYINDVVFGYNKYNDDSEFEHLDGLSYSFNEDETVLDVAYLVLCSLAMNGYLNKK